MRFAFIAKHRHIWPVSWLCEVLEVSRSGFHAWLNRPTSAREIQDAKLVTAIETSFKASDRTYGARRVWRDVLEEGLACGLHRIERLPWALGGMRDFETPGRHIFVHELKGAPFDFSEIKSRWSALSDGRLQEYEGAIPPEWAAARADIDVALKLIAEARDNIDACIGELGRILA